MEPITIGAVYENGVLKPDSPLPLKERERVQVLISAGSNPVEASYGILKWDGDPEIVRRVALDDEFSILEAKVPR
jgi:predicted DNA-binding antitoxin AbrB/MazE fold protein